MILKGTLITGFGKGSYFMKKENYKKAFEKLLGYTPWPGTFNIKLDKKTTELLNKLTPTIIQGFKEKDKTFGKVKCYPCIIKKNIKTHIVLPEINRYDNTVIEIISPAYLRKALNITDNDWVIIELK